MTPQNLHTHSVFCDGEDTPREVAEYALSLGMDSLGFSSHSYTAFDESYCLKDERSYLDELHGLKREYDGKLEIYIGTERDYFSEISEFETEYDFIIGSVHYLKCGSEFIPIDESPEILVSACEKYFGGDMISLAEEYFRLESDVINKTHCRIIGHFDLISKFSEVCPKLLDTDNPRYIKAERAALDELLKQNVVFEGNTGAMARGLRTLPYPSTRCLEYILPKGGKLCLTSDCHRKDKLMFWFDEAKYLLRSLDCEYIYVLKKGGFEAERI